MLRTTRLMLAPMMMLWTMALAPIGTAQVRTGAWPVIQPVEASRTFSDLEKASTDAPFVVSLKNADGAAVYDLECRTNGEPVRILQNDIDQAIEELLFAGGSLNRALLGADGAVAGDA